MKENSQTPQDPDEELNALNKEAEALFQGKQYDRAIRVGEKALGLIGKGLEFSFELRAQTTNNLAVYYTAAGNLDKAGVLYHRSLEIWEKEVGPNHPDVAMNLYNLAGFYVTKGDYRQAIPYMVRALAIWEETLGADHEEAISGQKKLAAMYWKIEDYSHAEEVYKRLGNLLEKSLGADHSDVADNFNSLGALYAEQKKYDMAEPLFRKALVIGARTHDQDHSRFTTYLDNLCTLYRVAGRDSKDVEPAKLNENRGEENYPKLRVLMNCGLDLDIEGNVRDALSFYRAAKRIADPELSLEIERRIAQLEEEITTGNT